VEKKENKWDFIANQIWEAPQTIEGFLIGIPYLILNITGTLIKLILFSLISILTLNKWMKLNELWSKNYFKSNISNAWNFVIGLLMIIIVSIIF
jgi:hypothetical protein